jgi:hypothetical protein
MCRLPSSRFDVGEGLGYLFQLKNKFDLYPEILSMGMWKIRHAIPLVAKWYAI